MNITRAQGRAALKEMEVLAESGLHVWTFPLPCFEAFQELGWADVDGAIFTEHDMGDFYLYDLDEVLLALAMVVAISGVWPTDRSEGFAYWRKP